MGRYCGKVVAIGWDGNGEQTGWQWRSHGGERTGGNGERMGRYYGKTAAIGRVETVNKRGINGDLTAAKGRGVNDERKLHGEQTVRQWRSPYPIYQHGDTPA